MAICSPNKSFGIKALTCIASLFSPNATMGAELPKSIFEISATDVDGNSKSLSTYKGKVLLIVNVASKCGFTPQYEGLEKIYLQYKDRGFEVLGFPSNDFGEQEPGSEKEIKEFCKLNYDVTFPLFKKGPVSGKDKQAVYQFLTGTSASVFTGDVAWNFEKFLIDRQGQVVDRFRSTTKPESKTITEKIEKYLEQK